MRKLCGEDLFTALRIVKNAGIEEEITKLTVDAKEQLTVRQIGAKVIISCICGCSNKAAEAEIWNFLSDLTEIPPMELKAMELDKLMDVIEELAGVISALDFADFFKRLSRLMQTKSLR